MILKTENIHKTFGSLEVLKGINLEIAKNEIVTIEGASGAGKSTLLHIIGTLDLPDRGKVLINQVNISNLNSNKLASFRNESIGFIFQFHNLLPEFTAVENVCIPAFIKGLSKNEAESKARELMGILGIAERSSHKPSELSGGEQQRVAVARALINDPEIIFADEPSGNLDSKNATESHKLFYSLREKLNQTFVIVTHNHELAEMSDRRLLIKDGVINGSA